MDLNYTSWKGIGLNDSAPFRGTFVGNGRSITGALTCSTPYCALFGYIKEATLTGFNLDIRVTSATLNNTGGLVAYSNDSEITNSTVNGIIRGYRFTGGIAGAALNGKIQSNKVLANITGTDYQTGGIVGYVESTQVLNNAVNGNNITGASELGGIAGKSKTSTFMNNTVTGAKFTNTAGLTGGIVGNDEGSTFTNERVSSTRITSSTGSTGLLGGAMKQSKADNCVVASSIGNATSSSLGGFVGSATDVKITNSSTQVTLTSISSYVGGFVGYATGGAHNFTQCATFGNVTSTYPLFW